jgi:hypothetical protein
MLVVALIRGDESEIRNLTGAKVSKEAAGSRKTYGVFQAIGVV